MSIVRLLRKLADCGQAIICTIHQASQEQFEQVGSTYTSQPARQQPNPSPQFDRVLALNRGGRTYYFGDIGPNGKTVIDYFARHGLPNDTGKNVADLLIEATAQHSSAASVDWCKIWEESPEAAATLRKIDEVTSAGPGTLALESGPKDREYASSTIQQIVRLTQRTMIQYWRTPDYIYSRLYCSFFHSLLTGLAFLQVGTTLADMQYRIFAYFMVLMIVPEFVNSCSMKFVENRNVWLGREGPSRIYGWVAFTTAQIIAEIPWALVGGVLYYVLFYFLIGFPLGTPAGYTFLMMMMFHLFCTSWGQWIAGLRYVTPPSLLGCSMGGYSQGEQRRRHHGCQYHAPPRHCLRILQRRHPAARAHAVRLGLHGLLHWAFYVLDFGNRCDGLAQREDNLCGFRASPLPGARRLVLRGVRRRLAARSQGVPG